MKDMDDLTFKAGFCRNKYHEATNYRFAVEAILGVKVYMSVLPAPFMGTPYLSEINVAHWEDPKGVWIRIDHPLATQARGGLFFLV